MHFYCRIVVYCALCNSKSLKISYAWRGMPIEFTQYPPQKNTGSSSDTARLSMMYDGSGRRISKTLPMNPTTATSLKMVKVTHYTGIGTEIREEFHSGSRERLSVVVNMPQRLGRNKVADASQPADDNASTMAVYRIIANIYWTV